MRRARLAACVGLVASGLLLVPMGAQQYFPSGTTLPFGGGAGTVTLGGRLLTSTTSAANVGTGETDLLTYTLPANSLSTDGMGVRVTAWGLLGANTNSKTLRIYFGGTSLVSVSTAANGTAWTSRGVVLRSGAATQVAQGEALQGVAIIARTNTTPAETLSGAVVIRITGQSAVASGDVTVLGVIVEALP